MTSGSEVWRIQWIKILSSSKTNGQPKTSSRKKNHFESCKSKLISPQSQLKRSFLGKTGAEYITKRINSDVSPINNQQPNEINSRTTVETVFVSMNLLILFYKWMLWWELWESTGSRVTIRRYLHQDMKIFAAFCCWNFDDGFWAREYWIFGKIIVRIKLKLSNVQGNLYR